LNVSMNNNLPSLPIKVNIHTLKQREGDVPWKIGRTG
jgi:hypothetical protein